MYWLTGVLGAVMVVAPYLMGYTTHPGAMWTSIVLGAVVVIASIFEAMDVNKAKWEYWLAAVAGLLAVIAPFVVGFTALTMALWTTLILGLIVLLLSGYELFFVQPTT